MFFIPQRSEMTEEPYVCHSVAQRDDRRTPYLSFRRCSEMTEEPNICHSVAKRRNPHFSLRHNHKQAGDRCCVEDICCVKNICPRNQKIDTFA
jgi:hypothetical protein